MATTRGSVEDGVVMGHHYGPCQTFDRVLGMAGLRVVIAPDSFKGTMTAPVAAQAMARGWQSARPDDEVITIPMADGGEGTLDIVHQATPGSEIVSVGPVTGPDGRPTPGHYLKLDGHHALIELAVSSGITLMDPLDALGATTCGLGETIRAALVDGMEKITVALGGSASTDGGIGALQALGLGVATRTGEPLLRGGGALSLLTALDVSGLHRPPRGLVILRDTTATLLEAPSVFGPQKGATPSGVRLLEAGLAHLKTLSGDTRDFLAPGSGAAGGTGWGLAHFLGGQLRDGAIEVGHLVGLEIAIALSDIVITGEGRFDRTSLTGKVTGTIIELARRHGKPVGVVCGSAEEGEDVPGVMVSSVASTSGSVQKALSEAEFWTEKTAMDLAKTR